MIGDVLLSNESLVEHLESILHAVKRRESLFLLSVQRPHLLLLVQVDVRQMVDSPLNTLHLVACLIAMLLKFVLQVDQPVLGVVAVRHFR